MEKVDIDRVVTTLKQIARDWSEFGFEERKACYGPIIDDILLLYPLNQKLIFLIV
jgi:carnosine N-methyltransferase